MTDLFRIRYRHETMRQLNIDYIKQKAIKWELVELEADPNMNLDRVVIMDRRKTLTHDSKTYKILEHGSMVNGEERILLIVTNRSPD